MWKKIEARIASWLSTAKKQSEIHSFSDHPYLIDEALDFIEQNPALYVTLVICRSDTLEYLKRRLHGSWWDSRTIGIHTYRNITVTTSGRVLSSNQLYGKRRQNTRMFILYQVGYHSPTSIQLKYRLYDASQVFMSYRDQAVPTFFPKEANDDPIKIPA